MEIEKKKTVSFRHRIYLSEFGAELEKMVGKL